MSTGTHIPALYQNGKNSSSVEICELYHIGLDKASDGSSVILSRNLPQAIKTSFEKGFVILLAKILGQKEPIK